MAERELVDKTHLLEEIKKLQKSPWYNHGKNDNIAIKRALYYERKEAVEVVRDLCINDEPTITEQEIIKPILDKICEEVLEYIDDIDIAVEICDIFDKYYESERK